MKMVFSNQEKVLNANQWIIVYICEDCYSHREDLPDPPAGSNRCSVCQRNFPEEQTIECNNCETDYCYRCAHHSGTIFGKNGKIYFALSYVLS